MSMVMVSRIHCTRIRSIDRSVHTKTLTRQANDLEVAASVERVGTRSERKTTKNVFVLLFEGRYFSAASCRGSEGHGAKLQTHQLEPQHSIRLASVREILHLNRR